MTDDQKYMIERFQCPGCVCGGDTECESMVLAEPMPGAFSCSAQVCGTSLGGPGGISPPFALGLPRGFNNCQRQWGPRYPRHNQLPIRLWLAGHELPWDRCNVPVWAMEREGVLYVRTCMPRVGVVCVDVLPGGALDMVPNAIDVGEFYDEIN